MKGANSTASGGQRGPAGCTHHVAGGDRGRWGGYLWLGIETCQLDGAPADGPRIWGNQFMKPVLCLFVF